MLNVTLPVQALRGLSIIRGVTPGSWSYPGGYATTYASASSGAIRRLEKRIAGQRIGHQGALACPLS